MSKNLCICKYAWQISCTNKLTHYLRKGKQSLQACKYAKGRNHCKNANDSFGKGFHTLKTHVLNGLMTGRCQSKIRPKFHSLFLQNSNKKVLHLKDINRHLDCTDVSFNPENSAFSEICSLLTADVS